MSHFLHAVWFNSFAIKLNKLPGGRSERGPRESREGTRRRKE